MTDKEIYRDFVGQPIIIMEKFDGKAHYDTEFGILFEDLHHKGKDHIIKYTSNRWLIIAFMVAGQWKPAVDEWYSTVFNFSDQSTDEFPWTVHERYLNFFRHEPLFSGFVDSTKDLFYLVDILKYQRSQYNNNQSNRMEGLVIFSTIKGVWAKVHNEWFSHKLKEVT